jgi:hypothetical protein
MAYIAKDDPVFIDGFCVEGTDTRCWSELAEPLRQFVLFEAAAGNKAFNIIAWHDHTPRRICVQLYGPAKSDLSHLPEGLVLSRDVYEGDMYAVIDQVTNHQVSFSDPNWKDEEIGT